MDRAERITWAINSSGKRNKQIATDCGVTPSAVSQWKTGDTKTLKHESLSALASSTGVSIEWLATGKGSPYQHEGATNQKSILFATAPALSAEAARARAETGQIPAGGTVGQILSPYPGDLFGWPVDDDAMCYRGVGFPLHTWAVIDAGLTEPADCADVLAVVGRLVLFRQLLLLPQGWALQARNQDIGEPPIPFDPFKNRIVGHAITAGVPLQEELLNKM